MSDCVFCRIVAKQIPSTVVHEDEHALAFMDIGQVNPGHVLVALKAHAENVFALEDAQAAAVFRAAARVARAHPRGLRAGGPVGVPGERQAGRADGVPLPRPPRAAPRRRRHER